MLIWCALMFALGAAAFLDSFYNYSELFRSANAFLFMLLSLGLLIRTSLLMKMKKREKLIAQKEKLVDRNIELEKIIDQSGQNIDDKKAAMKMLY